MSDVRVRSRRGGFCATVSLPILALAIAFPAAAQQSADLEPSAAPPPMPEIVVTGTYIRGSAEDAALPVDVIGALELANRGSPSTMELIKALPSSFGALGETNQFDSRSSATEGAGSVNLRALGPERTLVLLNGRRMAINPVPATSGGVVDTNLIPAAAISRVEVLKDGAAALYGSDAIAGVVNFITRDNQRGFLAGGDYKFIDGSAGDWNASLSWGGRIAGIKLFLAGGYQHRSRLAGLARDYVRKTYLENPNGGYTPISNPATYVPLGPSYTAIGSPRRDVNCSALNGFAGLSGTTPVCYAQSVQFYNLSEEQMRYQLFGKAEWDATDSMTVYVEGLFAHTRLPNVLTGPSQPQVQFPSIEATGISALVNRYFVPASNPGYASYVAANPGVFPSGAVGAQLVSYRPFYLGGNPLYKTSGGGESERNYEAFRVSGGVRGDISSSIHYDVGATYMRNHSYRTSSDMMVNRLQLALIGLGGPNCDSQPTVPGIQGTPGVGGCQYFNPFSTAIAINPVQGGVNPQFNPAVVNDPSLVGWFYKDFGYYARSRLFVVDAVLDGDSGIRLPGGSVKWAFGGQYRWSGYGTWADSLANSTLTPCTATPDFFVTDCANQTGPLSFVTASKPVSLSGQVYALFGEVSIPLFDTLSFQAAARYEDYGGGIGNTFNPKFAGKWEATDWLSFRGSISTTFRGPPLILLDPNPVTGLQNIRGVYRGVDNYGNPNLKPETATAYNLGVLVSTGGFRASVDFWNYKLRDVLTTEPINSLVSLLYPTNTTNRCGDPAYAAIEARFRFLDFNGNGTADDCAAGNIARVTLNTINAGSIDTNGFDFSASYLFEDLAGMDVTVGADATWTRQYKVSSIVTDGFEVSPAFDAVGKLNFQTVAYPLPEWKGSGYLNIKRGSQNLRLTARYFDGYTDQRSALFLPSVNYGTDGLPHTLPQGQFIKSWTVFDLAYRLTLPNDMNLTVAIDNMLNEDPPFVRLNYSYDPFTSNGLGRTVKVGLGVKF